MQLSTSSPPGSNSPKKSLMQGGGLARWTYEHLPTGKSVFILYFISIPLFEFCINNLVLIYEKKKILTHEVPNIKKKKKTWTHEGPNIYKNVRT
jgi:hypothetical protein